jgi:adenylate kinase family enzyme
MASQIARRLVILGAPGSGKGTIASRIVKTYGMSHIVVGDLLRQHIQRKSGNFNIHMIFFHRFLFLQEESKTIKEHIDKGILLPDELVLKFVVDELEKVREKGFLLDGKTKQK